MIFEIEIDEKTDQRKNLFSFLHEQKIKYSIRKVSSKDAAFGLGRKLLDEELAEYLLRCMESNTHDIDFLIDETKSQYFS